MCGDTLASLIKDAVRMRLMSDVPLGAFLSGGIDSSTVVGLYEPGASEPVQTFSIGFEDDTYNELPYAEAVAKHFGTRHHSEVLRPDIAGLAEQLVLQMDEPFADTSIFPNLLGIKLASRHVKVALSGDGGDELFAGYDTYPRTTTGQRIMRVSGLSASAHLCRRFAELAAASARQKGD